MNAYVCAYIEKIEYIYLPVSKESNSDGLQFNAFSITEPFTDFNFWRTDLVIEYYG